MISPQGYLLGSDPKSKNPFWGDGEHTDNTITATAEITGGTGTPSVSVTKTTSDKNINFDFNFKNLKGEKGDPGVAGAGVAAGGTAGQVLTKKSGTDYDTEWKDATGGGGGTTGGKIRLVEETDPSVFPQYLFKKTHLAEAQYTWDQSFSDVSSVPDTNYENVILTLTSDIKFTWNTDPSVVWSKKLSVMFDADYPEELLVSEIDNANKEYGEITSEGAWETNTEGKTINSVGRMSYYISEDKRPFIKIENFNYTDAQGEHNITAYILNTISNRNKKYADTVEKTESLQIV